VAGSAYAGPAPQPTGEGKGPLKGLTLDLSPLGNGSGDQSSIEVSKPMDDNDTYLAAHTMIPLVTAKDADVEGGKTAISFGRSSEPGLKHPQEYRYRSLSMGFGLEGVNSNTGFATRQQVATAAWKWLSDEITFGALSAAPKTGHDPSHLKLKATPSSSAGAHFTQFNWDFGDGSPYKPSKTPTVDHKYHNAGTYTVRVAVTDSLGHTAIDSRTITVTH